MITSENRRVMGSRVIFKKTDSRGRESQAEDLHAHSTAPPKGGDTRGGGE